MKGDFDRAIADFGKAIKLNPKYAGAYHSRGNAYAMKGDRKQAITDYRKILQLVARDFHQDPTFSVVFLFTRRRFCM